jgi:hypothetical protein
LLRRIRESLQPRQKGIGNRGAIIDPHAFLSVHHYSDAKASLAPAHGKLNELEPQRAEHGFDCLPDGALQVFRVHDLTLFAAA